MINFHCSSPPNACLQQLIPLPIERAFKSSRKHYAIPAEDHL